MMKNIDLFSCLNDIELQKIIKISTIKTLNKENILFYEGDEANKFYVLLDGHLKLYKTGMRSQEIVLHTFTKPTMVAEMATFENIRFPATSVAIRDNTKVAMIEKTQFMDMLMKDTNMSFLIIKSLTKKIKNLELSINRNFIYDATTKLCSLLKEDPSILTTQKKIQIANRLNIAPETLSRTIAKLKNLEILDHDNSISDIKKLNMFLKSQ